MEDYTKTYNRLPHILNRNILLKERKFSTQEIIDCFKKTKYDDLTNRERVLVSKMFKEIKDIYDLKAILSAYESDVKNIESIYINSPYCGFFDFWNSEFGVEKIPNTPFIPLKSSQIKSPTLRKLVAKKEALNPLSNENKEKLRSLEILQKCRIYIKNGWIDLAFNLAKDIQDLCKKENCQLPTVYVLDSKYGEFEFDYSDDNFSKHIQKEILDLVNIAEDKSLTICEVCGEAGENRVFEGWYYTSCELHKKEINFEQLEIIRKAKNLIQQTEKEAIEIIEKRKLCKLKCKDTDIDRRDLIINCFTKRRYSDLNYYERELVNSLFEEENQETIQDLIDNYFLDIEDIKAIFESSPYSENIEFLKVLNELFEDDISRKK